MQPRHTLTQLFSTFVQFENDRFSYWAIDARLQRHMQQAQAQTKASEAFWVLHWHRQWQSESLANAHLAAYVQEACYWAAYRLAASQGEPFDLPDRFQIAIATLPKVLKGYRAEQGASLKTYAMLSFSNTIRDRLRQTQESSRRTDWGLLRKISQKCLIEALQAAGLADETISRYRLAWTGFKRLYLPNPTATRQLAAPDRSTWQAIADFYSRQSHSVIEPETLESWLKQCAKQVRVYLSPPIASLNLHKFDQGSGELQEDLPNLEETPIDQLIAQEELRARQTQKTAVAQVLTAQLETLEPQLQTLLQLYYQQTLTQQQIAQQLDLKQYTVSRRLSSAKENLLKAIARWSQETLHISLTSPAVQQMSLILEEWLQTYYQSVSQPEKL